MRKRYVAMVGALVLVAQASVLAPAAGVENAPPDAPTDLTVGGRACTDEPTVLPAAPLLHATLTDPDQLATPSGSFSLARVDAPEAVVWSVSGTGDTAQVPDEVVEEGVAYRWSVHAIDDEGAAGPVATCDFVVDRTDPTVVPTIEPVLGLPAVYPEDGTGGGPAILGAFELRLDGPAEDVVAIAWRMELDGSSGTLAPGDLLHYAPGTFGPRRIDAWAVDASGRKGPQRTYEFRVSRTPIQAAPFTVDLPASVAFGHDSSIDMTLDAADPTPSGELRVSVKGQPVAVAAVTARTTRLELPASPIVLGAGRITVSYRARPDTPKWWVVHQLTLTPTRTVTKAWAGAEPGTFLLRVTAPDVDYTPCGPVELVEKGKVVRSLQACGPDVTVRVTPSPLGARWFAVRFLGTSRYAPSSATIRVAPATS